MARIPRRRLPYLSDDALLSTRFCDLPLRIDNTWLARRVGELYLELEAAGLTLRPHVWLSREWFSPGGVPGIAIPFYLAHPRLVRLERHMMGDAEGSSRAACLRILRHEAGHALQHSHELHRRKRWQQLFGSSSTPYPDSYKPNPNSRKHVLHLDLWYAQSHPDEDFAETFAEWLRPGSRWRSRYARWPALRKLEYIDALIAELHGEKGRVRNRTTVEPLRELKLTLGEHYDEKRARYLHGLPRHYDEDLLRIFVQAPRSAGRKPAGDTARAFMRRHRREILGLVNDFAPDREAAIEQVWREMSGRAHELKLRAPARTKELTQRLVVSVSMHTMELLLQRRRRHPM